MPRGHVALLPGHMCGWGRRPEEGPAKGLPSIVSPLLHAMCDHFPVDAVSVMPNVVMPMVTSRIMVAVMPLALPALIPLMSMRMPMSMIMIMPMIMPLFMPMPMIMPMPMRNTREADYPENIPIINYK
ncbi:hypothetical protein SISNIDRAFT_457931 [Sistotremastrum niveocremeum HHB9708]|uniref:Uncharacterized protein n=1 Tax=Sistotremastrum niveocremeum HHB9708 TaxID=1314777 RepID=A0A164QXD0_9AGAM|nr:hypothetical protein SISNIDRAFT_457931 [Sistotremastrum niveocremeum HHB9708]